MNYPTIDAGIAPSGHWSVLSRAEVARLLDRGQSGLYPLFRSCCLAVLASGSDLDDGRELLNRYSTFDVAVVERASGVQINLTAAPAQAFVDGVLIEGIREHLFSVLRDIVFVADEILDHPRFDLGTRDGTTDAVFNILRNAKALMPLEAPNLVVCWGGHSISRQEYEYSKLVGYELGLRGLDICTGCGPGAMKGPMKGAAIAHSKQRRHNGRYVGISEPGIIAAEAPNPITNKLVILPDIEKRLEAFVRLGHGIIVLPGGAGTMEEILYLLGILLHPDNANVELPLIFTGPGDAASYFARIDRLIEQTLGKAAQARYRIITGDPVAVAREMAAGLGRVRRQRDAAGDSYSFNWRLTIERDFQQPFVPTHQSMAALNLYPGPSHVFAASLRRALSGIVAGNVKAQGQSEIEQHGPFELHGEPVLVGALDELLAYFAEHNRMKLPGKHYQPCYRLVAKVG
ncbi:MAG: LOG family protein [Rhodocyclaceae bacterium]|nr:MAG: LOG family protein [Rhodocyclaceae bacterium]